MNATIERELEQARRDELEPPVTRPTAAQVVIETSQNHCPSCKSPKPELYPTAQGEDEVSVCRDPYHTPVAVQESKQPQASFYVASRASIPARGKMLLAQQEDESLHYYCEEGTEDNTDGVHRCEQPEVEQVNQSARMQAALSENMPVMIAWEQFKATDDYANAVNWATYPSASIEMSEDGSGEVGVTLHYDHIVGSLWAMFDAGWNAGNHRSAASPTDLHVNKAMVDDIARELEMASVRRPEENADRLATIRAFIISDLSDCGLPDFSIQGALESVLAVIDGSQTVTRSLRDQFDTIWGENVDTAKSPYDLAWQFFCLGAEISIQPPVTPQPAAVNSILSALDGAGFVIADRYSRVNGAEDEARGVIEKALGRVGQPPIAPDAKLSGEYQSGWMRGVGECGALWKADIRAHQEGCPATFSNCVSDDCACGLSDLRERAILQLQAIADAADDGTYGEQQPNDFEHMLQRAVGAPDAPGEQAVPVAEVANCPYCGSGDLSPSIFQPAIGTWRVCRAYDHGFMTKPDVPAAEGAYAEVLHGTCALGYADCSLVEFARGLKYFIEEESRKPNGDTHLIHTLQRAACIGWELARRGTGPIAESQIAFGQSYDRPTFAAEAEAEAEKAALSPCPWCRGTVEREDQWGSVVVHKTDCYFGGDSIELRVDNSKRDAWNQRRAPVDPSSLSKDVIRLVAAYAIEHGLVRRPGEFLTLGDWRCACGWQGLIEQMTANSIGGRTCPNCGASGGLVREGEAK